MCGICGIVVEPATSSTEAAVASMTTSLAHRGPDGSGTARFHECVLGHRRLSIVDLNTGDQPMRSMDGRVAITFNGEIYGYRDLRRSLDYPFRTSSDTEVILALYERHGPALLDRLPGMFAFAIWDDNKKRLFAARDRFGEKPFFYARGRNGEFIFASEIKGILASGLVDPEIDRGALAHYFRYLYVHPYQTIYRNVHVLPPAHRLVLENDTVTVDRYWHLPDTDDSIEPDAAIERFRDLFDDAVQRTLIADVPVAAFLSGGLDSSSVVAAAARHHPQITTISFGFAGAHRESHHAESVARLHGTNHVTIEERDIDVASLIEKMPWAYDEPFADSSALPTYVIARDARAVAKVVLTGDGGDELTAGYDFWYRPLIAMENVRGSAEARIAMLAFAARIAGRLRVPLPRRWHYLVRGAALARACGSMIDANRSIHGYMTPAEIRALDLPSAPTFEAIEPREDANVDAAMRLDLLDYMPGDILVKIDRASMAHGLELRAPFLDVDLASFCISLPARLKITDAETKWILRRAFEHDWPPDVRTRSKQGFGAPVGEWLKQPAVSRIAERIRDRDHPLYALIPFETASRYAARYDIREWLLLVLALWAERARTPQQSEVALRSAPAIVG